MEKIELNIYQRINKVRENNEYIQKSKLVDGKYMVVTHDQVTAALRADLIKQGVVIEPYLVEHRVIQDTLMYTKQKVPIIRFEAVFDIHFVNVDKPVDRATVRVPAHALDTGDKAPGKAVSYGVKMAMLKMFSIETGEEDEDRKEKESRGVDGLDEQAVADWVSAIHEITGKTNEEIDTNAQGVWEKIYAATEKAKDKTNQTKLRSQLTAYVTKLKKALKK